MLSIRTSAVLIWLLLLLWKNLESLALRAQTTNPRYNVVMVIFDDMRPAIGGYGDRFAKTPHLNEFMQSSHYFSSAYSQVGAIAINFTFCVID